MCIKNANELTVIPPTLVTSTYFCVPDIGRYDLFAVLSTEIISSAKTRQYVHIGISREHSPKGGGSITEQLVASLTGLYLTKQEDMLLFVCTETSESKPVVQ